MTPREGEIVVGILGQWASGKSSAAKTLIDYLGGEDNVIFITDREILAGLAVNYILELEDTEVEYSVDMDGTQRFTGELVTIYLDPGEELNTVDLNMLHFGLQEKVYDSVALETYNWLDKTRLEMGHRIRERSAEGKPIVIEAGFGTNMAPKGEKPLSHTVSDLFMRLDEAGVEPKEVKWIIIEASYEKRAERNRRRQDSVPEIEFNRFAADGGDLDPDQEKRLEVEGTRLKRVSNDHDDFVQFKSDIVAAFDELFTNQITQS